MIDIILLEPENEGNVGAVCRVMANFDFNRLVVVNPKCDLNSKTLIRRAKHGLKVAESIAIRNTVPKYDLLIGTTARVFSDYNVARCPLTPYQLRKKISSLDSAKVGILFGRESSGLTNREILKCDFIVTINTSKECPSMNLSHAVAVLLYELSKGRDTPKFELAREIEKRQIEKSVNTVIDKAGFSTKEKARLQKKIWKNIFGKALLTKREAFGVLGLLRKVRRKIS